MVYKQDHIGYIFTYVSVFSFPATLHTCQTFLHLATFIREGGNAT